MPKTTHKIRASECGAARAVDEFTATWQETTCTTCLERRPTSRAAAVESAPVQLAPTRVPTARLQECVDCYGAPITCNLCNRCEQHCQAKAPNDVAAHERWRVEWSKSIKAPKRRRR